jgi:hypothetical protein
MGEGPTENSATQAPVPGAEQESKSLPANWAKGVPVTKFGAVNTKLPGIGPLFVGTSAVKEYVTVAADAVTTPARNRHSGTTARLGRECMFASIGISPSLRHAYFRRNFESVRKEISNYLILSE